MNSNITKLRSMVMPESLSQILLNAESRRLMMVSNPVVLEYIPPESHIEDIRFLSVPGSFSIYIGRKGDKHLEAIKVAAKAQSAMPPEVRRMLDVELAEREQITLEQAVNSIADSPSFARVSYRNNPLLSHFAPRNSTTLGVFTFPYSGCRLKGEEFAFVNFRTADDSEVLDAVIVMAPPKMTTAERAAIDLVPDDDRVLHIGSIVPEANALLVAAAVVAFAVTYVAICAGKVDWRVQPDPIDFRMRLPVDGLRELIDARRRALIGDS